MPFKSDAMNEFAARPESRVEHHGVRGREQTRNLSPFAVRRHAVLGVTGGRHRSRECASTQEASYDALEVAGGCRQLQTRVTGRRLIRRPSSANWAFITAGAAGERAPSPMPVGGALLS